MAKKVIRSDIRVNKYISDSGFCSRREADKMIADERVTINGELATLGSRVAEGDKVKIDGEPLHFIPMEQREYKLRRYGSSRKEKLSGAENPKVCLLYTSPDFTGERHIISHFQSLFLHL